jgi:hypothetical protein
MDENAFRRTLSSVEWDQLTLQLVAMWQRWRWIERRRNVVISMVHKRVSAFVRRGAPSHAGSLERIVFESRILTSKINENRGKTRLLPDVLRDCNVTIRTGSGYLLHRGITRKSYIHNSPTFHSNKTNGKVIWFWYSKEYRTVPLCMMQPRRANDRPTVTLSRKFKNRNQLYSELNTASWIQTSFLPRDAFEYLHQSRIRQKRILFYVEILWMKGSTIRRIHGEIRNKGGVENFAVH